MVNYCAVVDCDSCSKYDRDVRFFKFPRDEAVCSAWIKACGKNNVNLKYERMCSLHFTEDDWCLMHRLLNTPFLGRKLDPKAVPSQNLPVTTSRNYSLDKVNTNEVVKSGNIQDFEQRFLKEQNTSQFLEEDVSLDNGLFIHSDGEHSSHKSECLEEPQIEETPLYVVLNQSNGAQKNYTIKCSKKPSPKKPEHNNLLNRSHEVQDVVGNDHGISALTNQLQKYKEENEKLRQECTRLRCLDTSIKSIFTEGQLKKLIRPKSKVTWTLNEIASAIKLFSMSPFTYQHLCKKNYPLPRPSKLRLWIPRIKLKSTSSVSNVYKNRKNENKDWPNI